MNLDNLPGLLLAWLKTQGSALLEPGQTQGKPHELPFKPGEQYEGKVVDSLANGRSLVKVADQLLDMALPKDVKVGDSVRLSYLNAAPRPTFLLDTSPARASQPVRLSDTSQQVNALVRFASAPASSSAPSSVPSSVPSSAPVPSPASGPTPGPSPSPAAQVGLPGQTPAAPAAALIQRPIVVNVALLQSARTTPGVTLASTATPGITALPTASMAAATVEGLRAAIASGTVLSTRVIWDQPAQASRILPQRLRQVLRESGLFYESHQAKWARGETALETLLREPQARLARLEVPVAQVPELKGMPEETARLAGRQLMMLEGQPFVWQGQAWPGQPMEWLVEERQPEGGGGEEAPRWRTLLRLVLPRLGEVQADLHLSAAGLNVRLHAADPASLDEVRAALPELMERLRAARLNPMAITAELPDGSEAA
ncbi:MAG TPA: flagellar hook-length control protein FliK [Thiobacillaceae bacterium]|nr:flagellar hook-length control protein FliK [Thiobacillaceae bacterium]